MSAESNIVRSQLGAAVQRNKAFSVDGILERMFANTFTGLVYPQIWEDPVQDMKALKIKSKDHIVAIASGGCNVMSYLTANPASVTAVDLSPAHIALNKLKYAGAQHLPNYGAFYQFFGRADVSGNAILFDEYIADNLDERTLEYWNRRTAYRGRRIDMFERGFSPGIRRRDQNDFLKSWNKKDSRLGIVFRCLVTSTAENGTKLPDLTRYHAAEMILRLFYCSWNAHERSQSLSILDLLNALGRRALPEAGESRAHQSNSEDELTKIFTCAIRHRKVGIRGYTTIMHVADLCQKWVLLLHCCCSWAIFLY